jgi:hypothetical protein
MSRECNAQILPYFLTALWITINDLTGQGFKQQLVRLRSWTTGGHQGIHPSADIFPTGKFIRLLSPIESVRKYQNIPFPWIASIQAAERTTDDSTRVAPIVPMDSLDFVHEIRPQVLCQLLSRVDCSAGNQELCLGRQQAHGCNHL